jgi:U3 small nucleolar RNA-associated protein 21
VWDLRAQKLHSVLRAHEGPVSRVYFFPREPLLLSCSPDNSLRMWIFDGADGSARQLKHRAGHTAPPRRIRYYGDVTEAGMGTGADARGCQILSAGTDRSFRVFNTARDAQSREMSQGPLLKKACRMQLAGPDAESGGRLRPIRAFAASETRARDWCNVITCHEGDCNAYVWRFEDRAIGKAVLRQAGWEGNAMMSPEAPEREAVCVAVTACGNYGLVGTRGGVAYVYNMQSGEPRGAFPRARATRSTPHESMLLERGRARPGSVWAATKAVLGSDGTPKPVPQAQQASEVAVGEGHEGPVTGVAVDSLNNVVMTAGLDGTLRFWDFKTHALLERVELGVSVALLEQARDSELLAAACDDCVIRVYDTATRRLVRRLAGHTTHVSDLCFSRDGRRLVSASADATVRVWDLPTGACVDWLRFRRPVTGVAMSHTGEYLCTSHVDRLGLYLWADRSFFQNVALGAPPTQPYEVDEPAPLVEVGDVPQQLLEPGAAAAATRMEPRLEEDQAMEEGEEEDPLATKPKRSGLLTLAMLPRAHWQTLFQLELIKQRNKPIEAPKAPPRAPFFLPTLHPDGVNPVFAPPAPSASALTANGGQPEQDEEAMLVGMSQAWSDDDGDGGGGGGGGGKDGSESAQEGKGRQASRGVVSSALNTDVLPMGSRILKRRDAAGQNGRPTRSKMATLLKAGAAAGEAGDEAVTRHLASLGPPQVDLEMQALCLGSFDEEGLALVALGLRYLARMLRSRRHFEVVQAYLARFLRIYSPLLLEGPVAAALRSDVHALRKAQAEANREMKELVQHNLCLVGFLSNLKGV